MLKIYRAIIFLLLAGLFCFSFHTDLFAMSVEPMSLDMKSVGKSARQSLKVSNLSSKPLPVEVAASQLDLGLNGEEVTGPATENFLIYPALAMIPPGGAQIFRVQWIGDPEIDKSQTYRLNVSQVPVKLPESSSGIQIVMNFGILVNVAPLQGAADIVVVRVAPITAKDGKRLTELRVKNLGNKHAFLNQSSIHLSSGAWSADMTPGEIAQKVGFGVVQPGKERRFVLPVEVPDGVSQIVAAIEQESAKR